MIFDLWLFLYAALFFCGGWVFRMVYEDWRKASRKNQQ